MTRAPVILTGLAVLAGATLAAAGGGLASLAAKRWGFTPGLDESAHALLINSPTAARVAQARAYSLAALRQSPTDNGARLRLVYIETLRSGALGPEGAKAFEDSYRLMPFDYTVASWRIGFGLDHWSELTPDARIAVRREALAFAALPIESVSLPPVLRAVRDPDGALAAAFLLKEIQR